MNAGLEATADAVRAMPEDAGPRIQSGASHAIGSEVDSRARVFISYRVSHDEEVAAALKKLLMATIDPKPEVFTSSSGGLEFSERGIKDQIREWVGRATFFIGVFTQKSVDRNWLMFEAGAAWGRQVPYTPVMVDVSFDDMPGVVSDLYAAQALDKEKVLQLVRDIANRSSAEVKPHFQNSYASFERTLGEYLRRHGSTRPLQFTRDENEDPEFALFVALREGRIEEAEKLLTAQLENLTDPNSRADVLAMRVRFGPEKSNFERSRLLNLWPAELKETFTFHVLRAQFERRPKHVLRELRAAALAARDDRETARVKVLEMGCRHVVEGEEFVLKLAKRYALSENPELVAQSVSFIEESFKHLDALSRIPFLVLSFARAEDATTAERLLNAVLDAEVSIIGIWVARRLAFLRDDSSSEVQLGRAYQREGLSARACMAYEGAADSGVSVAKANQALLHLNGAVASSALKILKQHVGEWDSSDHSYPHSLRQRAEQEIQKEEDRATSMHDAGRRLFGRLTELFESAMKLQGTSFEAPKRLNVSWHQATYKGSNDFHTNSTSYDEEGSYSAFAKKFSLVEIALFPNLWALRENDAIRGFLVRQSESLFKGVRFMLELGRPVISEVTLRTVPDATETSQVGGPRPAG